MFPLTHVYFSKQLGKATPYIVAGSMLPDIGVVGNKLWSDLHQIKITEDFISHSKDIIPEHAELYEGLLNHIRLDFFSHLSYKNGEGFAISNQTQELRQITVEALLLNDENVVRRKAHNMLECAIEHLVIRKTPGFRKKVIESLSQTNTEKIGQAIAAYFKTDIEQSSEFVKEFFNLSTEYDVSTIEDCILYLEVLNHYFFGHGINKEKTREALTMAIGIVESSYEDFLQYAMDNYKNHSIVSGH